MKLLDLNITGIIISFTYFCTILLASYKIRHWHEYSRKLAHIMIGNWYLLCFLLFDELIYALITPAVFVIYGTYSIYSKKENFITTLLRDNNTSSLGIILFPISLMIILTASAYCFGSFIHGGIAIMPLTYGDSMAALIGKNFPILSFKIGSNKKSLSGCLSMLIFSIVAIYIYNAVFGKCYLLDVPFYLIIILGAVATLTEFVTPSDYDNVSVPLVVFTVFYFFCQ